MHHTRTHTHTHTHTHVHIHSHTHTHTFTHTITLTHTDTHAHISPCSACGGHENEAHGQEKMIVFARVNEQQREKVTQLLELNRDPAWYTSVQDMHHRVPTPIAFSVTCAWQGSSIY